MMYKVNLLQLLLDAQENKSMLKMLAFPCIYVPKQHTPNIQPTYLVSALELVRDSINSSLAHL